MAAPTKPSAEPRDPVCPTCKSRITDKDAVMHHNCTEKSFRTFIGECIGEASMCWDKKGVFESSRAAEIVDRIIDAFHLDAGMNVTMWVELNAAYARLKKQNEVLRAGMEKIAPSNNPKRASDYEDIARAALAEAEGVGE